MAFTYELSAATEQDRQGISRTYAWTVFALTFGLALSDYRMSGEVTLTGST